MLRQWDQNTLYIDVFSDNSLEIVGNPSIIEHKQLTLKCNSAWTELFTPYEWSFNGEIIEGATNERYEKKNVTRRDAGNYSCEVSNGDLTKASDNITVTVLCKFLFFSGGQMDKGMIMTRLDSIWITKST